MEGWIKLHRIIRDHDIFKDESAFRVFMWILCSVKYETGEMTSGRFWASEILGINPNTYYAILKRLDKKYDLITLSSNNKNTTILVNNWLKYQRDDNTSDNNKITTKQQQNNTRQEIKNKRNKENTYSSINSLNEKTVTEIADQYEVSLKDVERLKDDLVLYCQSKGKKYANYKAALQNWVRRALDVSKIHKIPKFEETPVTVDVIGLERINKLRQQAYKLVGQK